MKKQSAFSRLMTYAGKRKYLTFLGCTLSALSSVLALVPLVFIFFIIKEAIDCFPNFEEAENLIFYGWIAVAAAVSTLLIYFAALMCSHLSAFRIASNMRKTALNHIATLPIGTIDEMGTGRARRIVNNSTASTEDYLAHKLPDMAGAIVTPLGLIAMLFVFDWKFGLASLLPVALSFACMFKMVGPKMKDDMALYNTALENMSNQAVEYVRGIPVVKTFGQTVHSFGKFKNAIDNYFNFAMGYTKRCMMPMLFYTTFINSVFAFLIALVLILLQGGGMSDIVTNFIFGIVNISGEIRPILF